MENRWIDQHGFAVDWPWRRFLSAACTSTPNDGPTTRQTSNPGRFENEIVAFEKHDQKPVAAVRRAAVTTGDSDSIACITGAFAGAYIGLDAWPRKWAEGIEYRQRLQMIGVTWDRAWDRAAALR